MVKLMAQDERIRDGEWDRTLNILLCEDIAQEIDLEGRQLFEDESEN